jgi:hypothetical protein
VNLTRQELVEQSIRSGLNRVVIVSRRPKPDDAEMMARAVFLQLQEDGFLRTLPEVPAGATPLITVHLPIDANLWVDVTTAIIRHHPELGELPMENIVAGPAEGPQTYFIPRSSP